MIPQACSYGIKEVCSKEQISYEVCNICIHVSIHKMLEKMVGKKE